jgi:glucose-6-phosphate isomerase
MSSSRVDLWDDDAVRVDEGGRAVGFFCRSLPARVDGRVLDQLREASARYGDKNVRLCLHAEPEASFHSMIVLEHPGRYYRPHKHLDKGESFHVLDGLLGVLAFSEDGSIVDACRLDRRDTPIYRVQVGQYHAVMPLTDPVIYHESKPGPFLGDRDSLFPDWAPEPQAEGVVADYVRMLLEALGASERS